MRMKLFLAAVSCLLLFLLTGYAQLSGQPQDERMKMLQRQAMRNTLKTGIRSYWEGRNANIMILGFLQDSEYRVAFGISDEQYQQLQDAMQTAPRDVQDTPEYKKLQEEMQAIHDAGDTFMQNADEATITKVLDASTKMSLLVMNALSDAIDDTLTPELKQKIGEAQLASMGELPVLSPSMFEPLNLTDAQKQQMEKIKKELEPEFEKNLENFANGQAILIGKILDERNKQRGNGNPQEEMEAIQKKLMAEDPECKKISEEIQSQNKRFATQFKTKLFDVLTDEQWNRLIQLIDNPPEYAKAFRKKLKEQMGEAEKPGVWVPGPNSWRPGDPIPEGYRQQRSEGRFPRNVQSE